MITDGREWLVADGLGGFASGTVDGIRTRRYHALLTLAAPRDERRFTLVNDLDLWVDAPAGAIALSSHRYAPDVVHPDGASRLISFEAEPWPTWRYDIGGGLTIMQELFATRTTGRAAMVVHWRAIGKGATTPTLRLRARPLLSGRDFHSLHHKNPDFRFLPEQLGDASWLWKPYDGVPPILLHANGTYRHEPLWFENFLYVDERARGLDDAEDLASPGELSWMLTGPEGNSAFLVATVPEEWGGYETAGRFLADAEYAVSSSAHPRWPGGCDTIQHPLEANAVI